MATKEMKSDTRKKAEKIRDWWVARDRISCDVIDGTIKSSYEQAARERAIGQIPAEVTCGGVPAKEVFCVGPTRFVFDHNVAIGYRFHILDRIENDEIVD